MEPKSTRSSSASDTAAMKAVAVGATAEQAAKLTKPVTDTKGFKTASWTAIPSPARTVKVEAPVAATAHPGQVSKPSTNVASAARPAAERLDGPLAQIQRDLSEIRATLSTLTEVVRGLRATSSQS